MSTSSSSWGISNSSSSRPKQRLPNYYRKSNSSRRTKPSTSQRRMTISMLHWLTSSINTQKERRWTFFSWGSPKVFTSLVRSACTSKLKKEIRFRSAWAADSCTLINSFNSTHLWKSRKLKGTTSWRDSRTSYNCRRSPAILQMGPSKRVPSDHLRDRDRLTKRHLPWQLEVARSVREQSQDSMLQAEIHSALQRRPRGPKDRPSIDARSPTKCPLKKAWTPLQRNQLLRKLRPHSNPTRLWREPRVNSEHICENPMPKL